MFLSETKCNARKINFLKMVLGMHGVAVEANEKSRGLALLWQKGIKVVLQSFLHGHIDVVINETDTLGSWRLTWISREPKTSKGVIPSL